MIRILSALLACAIAAPALAHPGAHVHPHGADLWLGLAALAAAALAGVLIYRGRR